MINPKLKIKSVDIQSHMFVCGQSAGLRSILLCLLLSLSLSLKAICLCVDTGHSAGWRSILLCLLLSLSLSLPLSLSFSLLCALSKTLVLPKLWGRKLVGEGANTFFEKISTPIFQFNHPQTVLTDRTLQVKSNCQNVKGQKNQMPCN